MNKAYNVIGSYRGSSDEIVNVLEGNKRGCGLREGVNGDGSDEFEFKLGIDEVVKIGEEVGLWKVIDGDLVEMDDMWDEFFDRMEEYMVFED